MCSFSVVVPCYDYGHFLSECVGSVLAQAGVEVRVLVIDDGSTDCTPRVARALVELDRRVEYRRHAENRGHIATYNEGLAWADGEYTLLLSADDLLTPGALWRASHLLAAHPNVGLVFGPALQLHAGRARPTPRDWSHGARWRIWRGPDLIEWICRTGINPIPTPTAVVRTSLQRQLGGYRPELPHAGDLEMWLRFATQAAVGEILDADQAWYRIHQRNMHRRQFADQLAQLRQRKAAFDLFFQTAGICLPHRVRLQRLAHRRLAREALGLAGGLLDASPHAGDQVAALVDFALRTDWRAPLTLEYVGVWARRLGGPQFAPLIRLVRDLVIPQHRRARFDGGVS